jgi:hypothetical protein
MKFIRVLLHKAGLRCGKGMDHQWDLHPAADTGWDELGWRCSVCGRIATAPRGHTPPLRD